MVWARHPSRIGDPGLIRAVEAAVAGMRGLGGLAVARVDRSVAGSRTRFAALGCSGGRVPTPHSRYELGSITKTWTGMLLADAVERGELFLADPLASWLPELAGTPAGGVTLRELATHTAGLDPVLLGGVLRGRLRGLSGGDPYGSADPARVIAAAGRTGLTARGHHSYSNLGFALLGHAEARAAGAADWPALLRERILRPLGMARTTIQPPGTPESSSRSPRPMTSVWPGTSTARRPAPHNGTTAARLAPTPCWSSTGPRASPWWY